MRELEDAIEHAVIVEHGPVVSPTSLPNNLAQCRSTENEIERAQEMGLREKLTLLERQILLDTLSRADGIMKHAADMLGIDARNLPDRLKKHHLKKDIRSH